jgi:hypothetical protein
MNTANTEENAYRIGMSDAALTDVRLPVNVDCDWKRSLYFLRQRKFLEAESVLRRLLHQYPGHSDLLLKLGIACHGLNRLDDASDLYVRSIKSAQSHIAFTDAFMQYCLCCLEQGMPEHVLRLMNKFPLLHKTRARFRYQRALAYLSIGDCRLGWEHYEARFDAGCSQLPRLGLSRWKGAQILGADSILVVAERVWRRASISSFHTIVAGIFFQGWHIDTVTIGTTSGGVASF